MEQKNKKITESEPEAILKIKKMDDGRIGCEKGEKAITDEQLELLMDREWAMKKFEEYEKKNEDNNNNIVSKEIAEENEKVNNGNNNNGSIDEDKKDHDIAGIEEENFEVDDGVEGGQGFEVIDAVLSEF